MSEITERIKNIINRSRKILTATIAGILVLIFIRNCINQIFIYNEDIEYLRNSLAHLYMSIENGSNKQEEGDVSKYLYNAQKQLINVMHEMEKRKYKKAASESFKGDQYDFAAQNVGGRVVSYHDTKLMYDCSKFLILIGKCKKINPPEKAIQRIVEPGEAFCFQGDKGSITIRLSCDVILESITIDHVDLPMTPNSNFSNAPKTISVTAMNEKHDQNGHEYEKFEFDPNKSESKTFILEPMSEKYRFVKINITENYGDPNQTCIYGIRVHGYSDECQ